MGMLNIFVERKKDDLFNTCHYLLKNLRINFTTKSLSETLENHADYPTLLSVKDSLLEYGITSAAIRKGQHSYDEFETPFISAIQKEGWPKANFTVVIKAESDGIEFLDPTTNKRKAVSLEDFEKMDKDVVLLLDTSTARDEANIIENRKDQRTSLLAQQIPLYLAFTVLLTAIIYILLQPIGVLSWFGIGYIATSFIGLGIASLLLWHEIDAHNPFIKEVCGGNSKKLNCNAVLSSSTSSLLGISWSVWGFAFFATFFMTQVLFPASPVFVLLWSGLSLLAAPYIAFSLYYQWKVIRQWCPLCLAIQLVLAVNAVIAGTYLSSDSVYLTDFSPYSIVITLLLGLSFLFLTYMAIPILKSANDSKSYEKKWKNLRYNPEIFQALLDKSDRISIPTDNLGIVIGNPDAQNEIIKVCNPYCGPCSKAHPELEHIIKNNPNVRVRIIFTATGEEVDTKTPPVAHLLAIQQELGQEAVHRALDDWYMAPIKDYEAFAQKYPMNVELKQQTEKIRAMWDWCNNMKIRATPTIYVNGRELPDSYGVADLKNFF